MRLATTEEIERWDELIKANPDGGDTLQTAAFATTKAKFGWTPKFVIYDISGKNVACLYLCRAVPLLGELWYAPKGPGVTSVAELKQITAQTKQTGVFGVKIEPDVLSTQVKPAELTKLGLIKVREIQYNWATVIVDLEPSEDDIIASFRQKTRYNIRLAERKGVQVEAVKASQENLDIMFDLMKTTAERAGVFLRSKDYFQTFWRLHAESGVGQLFFARFEGQIIAGAFITYLGAKGLYKDGGSVREHTEVQAPYLLQWEIIKWLKANGVTKYDLHGTPPAAQIENKDHPLAGLARFKTGFNAEITEFIGTYDLPLSSKYKIWAKIGERAMAGYLYRIKHELFY